MTHIFIIIIITITTTTTTISGVRIWICEVSLGDNRIPVTHNVMTITVSHFVIRNYFNCKTSRQFPNLRYTAALLDRSRKANAQTMLHTQPNRKTMVVKNCNSATHVFTQITFSTSPPEGRTMPQQRTLRPDRNVPAQTTNQPIRRRRTWDFEDLSLD